MEVAVVEVLQQASSQDPSVLKVAEQTLKEWETQRGFYTACYNVFSNHSLPTNVRWMAILYFKNGVDRYWRKHAPGAIEDDEKAHLRQRLIANFDEPEAQLAVQLAIVIAKIARYDYRREWGTLIPTLLDVIKGQNPLAEHRALLILHHVVKSLSSKCFIADRACFIELTADMFLHILNSWTTCSFSIHFHIFSSNDTNQIREAVEKSLLLLKILRKLILHGFQKPSESQQAMSFLNGIFEHARSTIECRKTLIARGIQMEVFDKYIIHLTKILIGLVEYHPFCYIELIPASLEFVVYYCFTAAGQVLTFERFVIQCLILMKNILSSTYYRTDRRFRRITSGFQEGAARTNAAGRVRQLKEEFFTEAILKDIFSRLVDHYFLLTPSELELWDTHPEYFAVEDGRELWKYSLRPCTESLFVVLAYSFKNVAAMVVVDLLQRNYQPVDSNDLNAILIKDAVYNAVGLAGFDLYDEVDFDQWFSTTLKEELKIRTNNYRIIRRRVCWLIGRWSHVRLSVELRPEMYKVMVEALSPDEDLGVRLAASDALRCSLDDFHYTLEQFGPYIQPAFTLLFTLLNEVEECDTKMHVLHVLSFLIERAGRGIKPNFFGVLISFLQDLWRQSEEHNMLRCAIVSTLVHLEKALGSESVVVQPLVVSVVAMSCNVNEGSHVYLLEDGLELWLALLENAPEPTPAIMDLFNNMPALLEQSAENLRSCLYIVKAYVLLSPQEFLNRRGAVVIETLESLLTDLRSEGIVMVMKLLETCLKASPAQSAELIKPLLTNIFENVYSCDDYCPMVITMYSSITARLLLLDIDIFAQVISKIGRDTVTDRQRNELKDEDVLGQMIYTWVTQMSYITQPKRCKLLALALCSLIRANSPPTVLEHFPRMIATIVETLNDIMNVDTIGYDVDSLVSDFDNIGFAEDSLMINNQSSPPQFGDVDYETQHQKRKKRLACNDPVHVLSLRDMLQNQLITLRRQVGDSRFNQLMSTLDPDIDEQLKNYISL